MKTLTKIGFAILVFVVIQSCELNYGEPIPDPAVKRKEDIEKINAFIDKYELGEPDTTEHGARYYIYHEGDQSQEKVKLNDIVTFDYTGWLLDSLAFMTTNAFVADTAGLDTLDQAIYTYSETGWSLRYVLVTAQYLSTGGQALTEAISTSFKQMVPGDRVVVFLPSDQALNNSNAVLQEVVFYDILLSEVEN